MNNNEDLTQSICGLNDTARHTAQVVGSWSDVARRYMEKWGREIRAEENADPEPADDIEPQPIWQYLFDLRLPFMSYPEWINPETQSDQDTPEADCGQIEAGCSAYEIWVAGITAAMERAEHTAEMGRAFNEVFNNA